MCVYVYIYLTMYIYIFIYIYIFLNTHIEWTYIVIPFIGDFIRNIRRTFWDICSINNQTYVLAYNGPKNALPAWQL